MPDPKKPIYAPYGSDKVNIDDKGIASPKAYPKTRTMGINKKNGNTTITVTNNETKKMLFSKDDVAPNGAKESNKFKSDSTDYVNSAKKQAEKINIGKVASSNKAYQNAKAFVGKK